MTKLIFDEEAKQLVDADFSEKSDIKRYAHIVRAAENDTIFRILLGQGVENPGGPEIVAEARRQRWSVKALCGAEFVPERNPDAYDACQVCMDVAGMLMRNAGE